MSDIVIRSGGVVEVDTGALRDAARALAQLAVELGELRARSARAADLAAAAGPAGFGAAYETTMLAARLSRAEHEADRIRDRVSEAATLYEAVELQVARDAAAAAGDVRRVEVLDARMARLLASDPEAVLTARRLLRDRDHGGSALMGQVWAGSMPFGPSAAWLAIPSALGVVGAWGRGAVPAGARLAGPAVPVSIRPQSTAVARPPSSLAEAAGRIPSGEARIRVERYDGANGTRQFALYVAGTRSGGAAEPFDMTSNVQLYSGERSASYAAVTAALRDAGARPGDAVHGFGHSQGAMVLERLAVEERYDMRTLVSFGSPVQADVGAHTRAVSVRHTDDPIVALQAGGHPATVGAEGSFVVERVADPLPGLHDLEMPAHQMTAYLETAALVDASTDPRAVELREAWAQLGDAGRGEGTDYVAERISRGGDAGAG